MRLPLLLLALLALLSLVSTASAQDPALAGARSALATYDLEGPSTLAALRDLGPIAARGGGAATEARYLRAVAGTDLYALSIALPDDTLTARLADALGVPASDLEPHLRAELGAVRTGIYRGSVADELQLLGLVDALERGDLSAIGAAHGPRADAVMVLGLAVAVTSAAGLGSLPDATAAQFPADRDASAAIAAIRAAGAAHRRAAAAAQLGDPWLARLTARMTAAVASLVGLELRPRAPLPASLVAATDVASGTNADVLIALDASSASIGCSPIVTMPDGAALATRTVSGHCVALPEVQRVPLGTLPAAPRAIDALTAALRAGELGTARSIALAPAPDAPLHVLVRALLSLAAAGLTPTHLALRAADGTLVMMPFHVVHEAELGAVDLSVHLRLGGYVVQRGRGRETSIPRVRGASGLEFDRGGLERALRERPPTSVAIDGMTNVPASEIAETARISEASGASVTLVLP